MTVISWLMTVGTTRESTAFGTGVERNNSVLSVFIYTVSPRKAKDVNSIIAYIGNIAR